jgi:4-amino-4-deoxy-L-arabinose transferase-like glycosyltransferase
MIVFPFIALSPPKTSYPTAIAPPEITGGLLPTAPVVAFVLALPWLWRRRPARLGPLAVPLMVLVGAAATMMLVAAYEYFVSTQRYEVDFATPFVLAGLAAWLALANGPPRRGRLLLRVGGGLLVAWGCAIGFAISFFGYGNLLAVRHPGTWRTLEDIGAPLSTAIAAAAGHPLLAANFVSESAGASEYVLGVGQAGPLTLVSPGAGTATLTAKVELLPGTRYELGIEEPDAAGSTQPVLTSGETLELPVRLERGLNHLTLYPLARSPSEREATTAVMRLSDISLASGV